MTWTYSKAETIGGHVELPEFTGEKIYMQPFKVGEVLPKDQYRWQPIVDMLLEVYPIGSKAWLMVDQAMVKKGELHRRGGVHIDGLWIEGKHSHLSAHGGGGGHAPAQPDRGTHKGNGGHGTRPIGVLPQDLFLCSNVAGCKVYEGDYIQRPTFNGGDCSYVPVELMDNFIMSPNYAYYGDAMSLLHESIPVKFSGPRTVVRINVEREPCFLN